VRVFSFAQFPVTRGSNYIRARSFGILGKLPGVRAVARLARWRSLPAFATRPLRDRVKGQVSPPSRSAASQDGTEHAGITVCYFAGCMIDRLYPEMGEAAMNVLRACGVLVTFPRQQQCCGLLALNSGDRADCTTMARQTITMLEQALAESKADYIVGATTSCVVTLTQDYSRLFEDLQQQGWFRRARARAGKVMDFASFVEHVLLAHGAKLPVRERDGEGDAVIVTYHDSCQSVNCLGLRSEARHIIQDVLRLELREMAQSDVCCGFGGATSIEHADVAERILNNKLINAESTGATVLVTDNPGCLMHVRGGVDASGRKMRVLHLAQLIAEQLEE
jgi:L-lactate dehydrogenase complex protein LldF